MPDQSEQPEQNNANIINGINVTAFNQIVESVRGDKHLAKFKWRAKNAWDSGGLSRTKISGFYGAGEEQGVKDRSFVIDADEPPVLLSEDRAPNAVEYLLHALTACLTSTIIYKAAARGIAIESVESSLEGDLDARAFLELSDEERKGFQKIRANFRVKSSASEDELREIAEFSPVLDVISNGTPVSLQIEKG